MSEPEGNTPSNAELKKLLDRTLVRFENWRVEVESNPNPHAVHQLKSLVSIIDSISSMAEKRMQFSYKQLSQRMASLVHEVAELNMMITTSLARDDYLDEEEERQVTRGLVSLVQSAVGLISMVQESFGSGRKGGRALIEAMPLLDGPAAQGSPAATAGGSSRKGPKGQKSHT